MEVQPGGGNLFYVSFNTTKVNSLPKTHVSLKAWDFCLRGVSKVEWDHRGVSEIENHSVPPSGIQEFTTMAKKFA